MIFGGYWPADYKLFDSLQPKEVYDGGRYANAHAHWKNIVRNWDANTYWLNSAHFPIFLKYTSCNHLNMPRCNIEVSWMVACVVITSFSRNICDENQAVNQSTTFWPSRSKTYSFLPSVFVVVEKIECLSFDMLNIIWLLW